MRLPLALLLTLLLGGAGCGTAQPTPDAPPNGPPAADQPRPAPPDDRRLAEARAELDAAIGDARATSAAQCRVVAVGSKACGGPSSYRVYSAETADAEQITALAAEITALEDARNRRDGLISDCALLTEPTPTLEAGRCTAR